MSIPMRYAPRRAHVPYWWILATVATALIALGPIVAAVVANVGGGPRTAFASAAAGNYAVVARPSADEDVIYVVPADGGEPLEITRVPHLSGYMSYGSVAPDGRRIALVTADGGARTQPVASLLVVELESGKVTRLGSSFDYLQTPVWTADGSAVAVTRSSGLAGTRIDVALLRVGLDGSERQVAEAKDVLGAYAIGFDAQGRLVHVAIDARGSVLYRDGAELMVLAPGITRDWRLSPDGTSLAFVETATANGVQYFPRTVALDGGEVSREQFAASVQALGVAWEPGTARATFGVAPGDASSENAHALTAPGFDVPLAYSRDGRALAVQHWSGTSFTRPGEGSFEIVDAGGSRTSLEGFGRFYGWAAR